MVATGELEAVKIGSRVLSDQELLTRGAAESGVRDMYNPLDFAAGAPRAEQPGSQPWNQGRAPLRLRSTEFERAAALSPPRRKVTPARVLGRAHG